MSVQFGALRAVDAVSHSFFHGQVYGLIGPNGAGKTTLLNVLSGQLAPHSGQVFCNGLDISRLPAHKRAQCGIGRSFQITKIFPEMSVAENLLLAAQARKQFQPFWIASRYEQSLGASVNAMLELMGLSEARDAIAGALSYGLQRALELGVTLMPQPGILLLDEPLAGVGQHEIERTKQLIHRVAQDRTVLLIEHNMHAVMTLSDEILVMNNGAVIASGSPQTIRNDPVVRSVYLGQEDA